ncbi:phospholipase D-like domain-containing protein [Pseudoalteromonas sp. NJ631]|uniref:phospholipase D-like domain-containing protein n=1 Tax=Pseudoalteromonas sp. NJ631 TaxID=493915 RepID=UPI0002E6A6EB|nr:phospholipase D-like domain-containing protein [Pseudoalteromonas sp. NJ631]
MNLIEKFTKTETKIVDQSNTKLPPVLLPVSTKQVSDPQPINSSLFCNELQARVVELIDKAEHSVILSTFLLADENVESAVLKAAKRKVRVYILLACETRLDGDVPDDDFGKKCLVQHKEMLNKLSGHVHFASAPHFHAKAVVIDALHETGNANGLLLTANLTEEALKRNEELGVSLSQYQIDEIVKVFRWAIFESAQHHMTSRGEFSAYKSPGNVGYPRELTEILVTSSEDARIREHALALINKADKELTISSFGWQEDHLLVKAICERAKSGVKVTVLSRQRPAAMPALLAMKEAGASVMCFKWLHAKAIVVDGMHGMVMSANFQTHGMDQGFELGVKLTGTQVTELMNCLNVFLANIHNELHINMSLGMISGGFEAWEKNAFKGYLVNEVDVVELSPIKADCLSDMDKKPNIPNANWRENTSQKIEYKWRIEPPVTTNASPEYFKPLMAKDEASKKQDAGSPRESYEPKVVRLTKKQLAITVRQESELAMAKRLKQSELPNARILLEA